jgi:hypothetical protein
LANSFTTTVAEGEPTVNLTTLSVSPLKVSTDEGMVTERPLKDVIAAEQYIAAKAVGDDPLHGLRISRMKPAGPV